MHVRNMIEASAEIVTITTLKRGDVYKRIVPATQFGEAKIQYGVVTDVMNNGDEGAITALEYDTDYTAGVVARVRAFDADADVALFAAQPAEILEHVAEMRQAVDRKVRDTEQAAAAAQVMAARTREILDGMIELTAPETRVGPPEPVPHDSGNHYPGEPVD